MFKLQLELCERGNILITHYEENWFQAYLRLGQPNQWLEVSWRPCNYPALNIQSVEISDIDLAAHIRNEFAGWIASKMNLEGVPVDELNIIIGSEDPVDYEYEENDEDE